MDKVREKIKEYITNGVIKTEGIRKLKREFKINEKELGVMWLEEKENIKSKYSKRNNRQIYKSNKDEVVFKAIKTFGEDMQKIVAMEELAELQQALSKDLRGKDHNVEEEIADVYIMLMQLELMYDKTKIEEWIDKKIDRLDKRLRG
jgi:NTP pyrophosphatase (non-canonical NTP hydrolase)|nr:MAG TPA: nucleoside triphosphate pyrophosphohydrolase [Caudoviricetes sp.]